MIEAHQQVKNGNVLKFLKDYWFLVVFIIGAAFAWSELRAEVKSNTDLNKEQKALIISNVKNHNLLSDKYIEDITWIKTVLQQLE